MAYSGSDAAGGSRRGFTQKELKFGEDLFNRIEVGRVFLGRAAAGIFPCASVMLMTTM
ncbi:hypothetical protein BQ8794_180035 [Mesorhizobium prunaredense]|uniref:Uncharacterized protein n=1 Tax=Mesorhizobium prunaredense TaxID=1631249 RepID=A0A1R3V474_9HYPH|nr:hypothetical protein BQ8794_180035 [Mesorhizobium prunaredense]